MLNNARPKVLNLPPGDGISVTSGPSFGAVTTIVFSAPGVSELSIGVCASEVGDCPCSVRDPLIAVATLSPADASPRAAHDERERVIRRISADALESQLAALFARLLPRLASDALDLPSRIEVHGDAIHLTLPKSRCTGIQGRLTADERIEADLTDPSSVRLIAAIRIRNRCRHTEIRSSTIRTTRRDPVLIGGAPARPLDDRS